MNEKIATRIYDLIMAYKENLNSEPKVSDFPKSEYDKMSPKLKKKFKKRSSPQCFLRVEKQNNQKISFQIILDDNNNYYVFLYDGKGNKQGAEIHKVIGKDNQQCLTWKYSPSKWDRKNEERKACFEKHYSNCEVFIPIPSEINEVSDFLNELMSLYHSRIKADVFDESTPDSPKKSKLESHKQQEESDSPLTQGDVPNENTPDFEEGFPEGKKKLSLHEKRERNSSLIKIVKQEAFRKYQKLECQCCGFDFEKTYGEWGREFIEGHHTKPVSELDPEGGDETKKEDIALVCSNCHRMLHRRRPWLTMSEIKNLIKE